MLDHPPVWMCLFLLDTPGITRFFHHAGLVTGPLWTTTGLERCPQMSGLRFLMTTAPLVSIKYIQDDRK